MIAEIPGAYFWNGLIAISSYLLKTYLEFLKTVKNFVNFVFQCSSFLRNGDIILKLKMGSSFAEKVYYLR